VKRRRVAAIAGNELRQVVGSREYLLPLGGLAALFFVVIPIAMLGLVTRATGNEAVEAVGAVIETLPDAARQNIRGATPQAQASFALAVYLLAPIAIVVPLTIASAVGATAVVGERERGTGEFLAHSPATELEIYVGKLIASLVPGYAATILGFAAYSLVVNAVVGPTLGGWFFPTADWWLLIFWVVPPFLAVALAVIVAISARVKTAAAAQQASQLVTLPVILTAYGVATGLVFDAVTAAVVIGLLAWLAAITGLVRGARAVDRERLIGVER
jgi:ABC-type Na+ efflux pump permease subunit